MFRAKETGYAEPVDDLIDQVREQWARERPGMPVDSIGVVGRILRIAKLISDERRRVLAGLGIDVATFDLLATLRRSGTPYRLTPAQLAGSALVSPGAVTQRVSRAEAEGLVRTHRTGTGRRTVAVELTPRGHEVIEHDIETLLGRERELIAHLTPDDRERLAMLLRHLLAGLSPN
jgi:DNA-binding MarR family transcriptional regulator